MQATKCKVVPHRDGIGNGARVNTRLFVLGLLGAVLLPLSVASFQRIDASAATKSPTNAVITEVYANGSARVLTPNSSKMKCCHPLRVEYQADGIATSGFEPKRER